MASHTSPDLSAETAPPRRPRRGRVMITIVILIVLGLLVPPFINVNRYRLRVADAIGRALGRDVTVSGIELKLLPHPGMVLSNFVVADDPAFSPEPMLRADTVTAYPRLSSLWRGRLEIGTLELENPSLNLVRRTDGHWNAEELIERSSQVPSAPTSAQRAESRLRFPYVEATAGRINFKVDQVKKALALTDADFGLWQASENEWGVRLEARPIRTDISISDTGTLRMEGHFQRAAALRDTPLNLSIYFSKGQLGQITKLIYGRDRGWRGGTSANAILSGTLSSLGVTFDAQVEDFRRYDIALGEALRFRVHCTGTYSSPDESVNGVICESPINQGSLRVTGSARNWGLDGYQIDARAEHVPMDRIIAFARHVKKDLPVDLTAIGEAECVIDVRKRDGAAVWTGGGRTSHFALRSSVLKEDVPIGELEFVVPGTPQIAEPRKPQKKTGVPLPAAGFGIVVKPFAVPLGAASPATATGYFDDINYRVTVSGEAEMARLVDIANALGIATPGIGLAGSADVDMDIAGSWAGFAQPMPAGRMQLHKVTAEVQGISEPLIVEAATASLADQTVHINSLTAGFNQGPQLSGALSFPLHCTDPQTCVLHFDLHADDVTITRANQLLNPKASQPWYRLLAIGRRHDDALLRLRANGTFTITRLSLGTLTATNATGMLALDGGKLRVDDLRADLMGGRHTASWNADFTASPPTYSGHGAVSRVSIPQLSALMKDNWATGTLDASYQLALAGMTLDDLRLSASGAADFTWNAGVLRHVVLERRGAPITFTAFTGTLSLKNGSFALADGQMQSVGASYTVSGTAGFDRSVDFRLNRDNGRAFSVTGPLDRPIVEPTVGPSQAQVR